MIVNVVTARPQAKHAARRASELEQALHESASREAERKTTIEELRDRLSESTGNYRDKLQRYIRDMQEVSAARVEGRGVAVVEIREAVDGLTRELVSTYAGKEEELKGECNRLRQLSDGCVKTKFVCLQYHCPHEL